MANTVFIIGAGASKEVNLPTGYELKAEICEMLNLKWNLGQQESGDYLIVQALKEFIRETGGDVRNDLQKYINDARHIRNALPQAISIDNFIDAHRQNEGIELCGKLAIARAILKAEKESLLYIDENYGEHLDFTKLENTWFLPFFQCLTESCTIDELEDRLSKVSLIIFNYDRCVEYFLIKAFITYYGLAGASAIDLVKSLDISHPYGVVSSLRWFGAKDDALVFGGEPDSAQLLSLASGIKTFTESVHPGESEIVKVRSNIELAERLVFLGFAFHELNMEILRPLKFSRLDFDDLKCFATVLDVSESDQKEITRQISSLYQTDVTVNLANVTCTKLFSEFRRGLAFKREYY